MVCRNTRTCITVVLTAFFGVALNNLAFQTAESTEKSNSFVTVATEGYVRAERFLPWNIDKYVQNGKIVHHWIGESDRLWYKRQTNRGGKEFILVNAESGIKQPAFDHKKIAAGLTEVIGVLSNAGSETYTSDNLPFDDFSYTGDEAAIKVTVNEMRWRCGLATGTCTEETSDPGVGDLVSPDGKWAVFLKGPNLWLRSLQTGDSQALTTDGKGNYGYGVIPGSSGFKIYLERKGEPIQPLARWSPDSKKLVVARVDEREVLENYLIQHVPESGSVRPLLYRYRYALPADEHKPSAELFIFDIELRTQIKMQHPPLPVLTAGPFDETLVEWSDNSSTIYVVPREEGLKRLRVLSINAATGATRQILEEHAETFLEASGEPFGYDVRFLSTGEIIWYSQRDGWGHLYLYDENGNFKRQLTHGEWAVRKVVHVDEKSRDVYFLANGREPGRDIYFRHLYAVNIDNQEVRLVTPENADHNVATVERNRLAKIISPGAPSRDEVAFSPSGRYFVESYSRVDMPPVTVLRKANGVKVAILEEANISKLNEEGVRFAEPFKVLAADGVTPIYGNIYKPTDFDSERDYPVIDAIYPGPQATRTKKDFMGAMFDEAHAIAELGFIVVTIDGRGTPYRSKAFQDDVYGHMEKAGNLDDHIAGIKQLAERFSYMDIGRVGIHGYSGGGYAAARAILAYPDFYKVAVSGFGNHDQRGYSRAWGPSYQGLYDEESNNYEALITKKLAGNLKGKLFLEHGELDENVHPAHTMQLVDALIKANKDFDFLILPNTSHSPGEGPYRTYYLRRQWDYFVRHLLHAEPPENYKVVIPGKVK